MELTTYGYKKPEDGETGSTFFPALNFNTDRLDGHTHNGLDSSKITSAGVTGVGATISSGSWVHVAGGTYRQLVSLPAGFDYDDYHMSFRLSSSGHMIYPTVEKVSSSTYYVYINDNSVSLRVVYTS